MNKQRLDEIRKRADAATVAPWTNDYNGWINLTVSHENFGNRRQVANCAHPNGKANATFVAHARQDIPDLLDYIGKLEDMLDTHVPGWEKAKIFAED